MDTPGLQETVQLANVFSSFLSEMMRGGHRGRWIAIQRSRRSGKRLICTYNAC